MVLDLFRRTSFHFSGLLLGKVLSVAVFVLVARAVQPEKFGVLLLFITLVQLTTVLANFGLKGWYQKMAAKLERGQLFSQLLNARLFSWLASALLLLAGLIVFRPFTTKVVILLLLATVSEALLSMAEGYYLQNKQSLKAGLRSPSVMLLFLLGWLLLGLSTSLLPILAAWVAASVLTVFWYFPFKEVMLSRVSLNDAKQTLRSAAPYALLTSASLVYARADQLLVAFFRGSLALGLYGAAYRYLDTLSLLPSAIYKNLFPEAAKTGIVSYKQLGLITLISSLVGLVLAALTFLLADFLTTTLLGASYSFAAVLLRIFSLVLFLFFINAPLSSVVQSSHLVKRFLPFGVGNTLLNIALNLLLIPIFGVVASAWVMVLTEFTGLVINLIFVKRVYE